MQQPSQANHHNNVEAPKWVVVIGANTGGPQALAKVLPQLPADFPATVFVVQQMRRGFSRVLTSILGQDCALPVVEPVDGQALSSSRILVAPSGSPLTLNCIDTSAGKGYNILVEETCDSREQGAPRTDTTMSGIASVYGSKTIGILLTGLGTDGREGMRAIAGAGGITIAQDEPSSVVHDLAASAIDAGVVQEVLPLWSIADRIITIVMGESCERAA